MRGSDSLRPKTVRHGISAVVLGWLFLCGSLQAQSSPEEIFFEQRIRPVLVTHCYECHSAASAEPMGGLRLDWQGGWMAGGDSGAVIEPGDPASSALLAALRYEGSEMPPTGQLPDAVIGDFERWVSDGAVDPRREPPQAESAAESAWEAKLAERSRWWSLQPWPHPVAVPDLTPPAGHVDSLSPTSDSPSGPIDTFIAEGLRHQGLRPAPPADPVSWHRRLHLVLTGLPPAEGSLNAFLDRYRQQPEEATRQLVDRLLAAPAFGQRMARHWMDVVRYTDTYGYEWDNPVRGSWEYRDYVVRAFNADVPYARLVHEQLAGDLLDTPRLDPRGQIEEQLIGPTFFHLGEHRHGSSLDFNGIHQDMVDNKIDAFSKTFLGMTIACARCHDHKLDAISQADYYALAALFMQPRWTPRVLDADERYRGAIARLTDLRQRIEQLLADRWRRLAADQPLTGEQLSRWAEELWAGDAPLPAISSPAYPLAKLAQTPPDQFLVMWQQWEQQWLAAGQQAADYRQADRHRQLADFLSPKLPDGWVVEGAGAKLGFAAGGTPLVSLTGETAVVELLEPGYHSHHLSSKLPGALRFSASQPWTAVGGPEVLQLRVAGGEFAGYLEVPQNAFQNEPLTFFDPAQPASWIQFSPRNLHNGVERVLVELATCDLNPNFPPRTGLARAGQLVLADHDAGLERRSWWSVTGIWQTPVGAGPPPESVDGFAPLLAAPGPADIAAGWQRLADWLTDPLQQWGRQPLSRFQTNQLNWLIARGWLPIGLDQSTELSELVAEYRRVEASIDFPRTANSMDGRGLPPIDYPLNMRGDPDQLGPRIAPRFLAFFEDQFNPGPEPVQNRLQLAEQLTGPLQWLTARVYVNRLWQAVFGTGLVRTTSDFGHLGDLPEHPELLDWLAQRLIDGDWSTKRLLREMLLSDTFGRSGASDAESTQRDPSNRHWHHYPTRRMEAEVVRDSLLSVAGQLDRRFGGRPLKPHRLVEDSAKRLFSGPLDGDGRRSLYLEMSIMAPPSFLVGFNLPDPRLPGGTRDVTQVPAQALLLLNDPLVAGLAEAWARELVRQDRSASPEERLAKMFQRSLARPATDVEVQRWRAALYEISHGRWIAAADSDTASSTGEEIPITAAAVGATHPRASGVPLDWPDWVMQDTTSWQWIAHGLFNTKEFIFYQ
jgi:hypothetical protein